jgi:hypothetical protein
MEGPGGWDIDRGKGGAKAVHGLENGFLQAILQTANATWIEIRSNRDQCWLYLLL